MYVPPPVPRCSDWASSSLVSPSRVSLPRHCIRVGLHIVLFEACSAFTRVAARTLAPSPIRDRLHRRLQPFRHLHDCSGCFRLERSPGGTCTHWKAPPSHGARKWRSFTDGVAQGQIGPKRGPDSVCYQRERNAVIVSTWDRVVVRVFRTMAHAGLLPVAHGRPVAAVVREPPVVAAAHGRPVAAVVREPPV